MNALTIAYFTEGPTDQRFLKGIIDRTYQQLLLEASNEIELFPPMHFGKSSISEIRGIIQKTDGYMVLCIHCDADAGNDSNAYAERVEPIFQTIRDLGGCDNLVAIVPIHMTESWMLADKQCFKEELDTNKKDSDLGIHRHPETIADPKKTIIEAIRIVDADLPRKERHQIKIGHLYSPLSYKIRLTCLEQLSSYSQFRSQAMISLRTLGFLN